MLNVFFCFKVGGPYDMSVGLNLFLISMIGIISNVYGSKNINLLDPFFFTFSLNTNIHSENFKENVSTKSISLDPINILKSVN